MQADGLICHAHAVVGQMLQVGHGAGNEKDVQKKVGHQAGHVEGHQHEASGCRRRGRGQGRASQGQGERRECVESVTMIWSHAERQSN